MAEGYPYPLLDDPAELAGFGEWTEDLYRDFAGIRDGTLTAEALRRKYVTRRAILCLDMTGFTQAAIRHGELQSLMRIWDVQRVCGPVFKEHGSLLIRAFADDLVALFDRPDSALDAALEAHRRVRLFNASGQAMEDPADVCIGIGYGDVFSIGPNLAMGDEMNRASKLGEDTARAHETLVTQNVYDATVGVGRYDFAPQNADDLVFPFFSVTARR